MLFRSYRKQTDSADSSVDDAIQILEHHFDEFTKKHYEKIQRSLDLDDDDLKGALNPSFFRLELLDAAGPSL